MDVTKFSVELDTFQYNNGTENANNELFNTKVKCRIEIRK